MLGCMFLSSPVPACDPAHEYDGKAMEPVAAPTPRKLPFASSLRLASGTQVASAARCRLESSFGRGPLIEADLSRRRRAGTAVSDPFRTLPKNAPLIPGFPPKTQRRFHLSSIFVRIGVPRGEERQGRDDAAYRRQGQRPFQSDRIRQRAFLFRCQIAARCVGSVGWVAKSFPSRSSMRPARLCRASAMPTWFGRAPLHAAVISCCVLPVASART
jgi:hypothetical protein